jgi:hypothetical protein
MRSVWNARGKNWFQIPNTYTSLNVVDHVLNHVQELKEAKPRASHGKTMPRLRTASLAFPNGAEPQHDDAGGFWLSRSRVAGGYSCWDSRCRGYRAKLPAPRLNGKIPLRAPGVASEGFAAEGPLPSAQKRPREESPRGRRRKNKGSERRCGSHL